jgi:hypothetical protein
MVITNYDQGGMVIGDAEYQDAILTHAGSGTIKAGTILARVTASGKFVVYNSSGSDGSEIPCAVLTIASVSTGSGDKSVRPLIGGKLRTEKVIDPNTTSAPTAAVQDLLRKFGIICVGVRELNVQDNQ